MEETKFQKMIKELCKEMNIEINKLSYDWILELKKNNKKYHIVGNEFGLNSEAASTIASDKYATYEILSFNNIPVIKHTMLFNPEKRKEYTSELKNKEILENEVIKNKKVVIKPNDGAEGLGVYLCNNIHEAEIATKKLFDEGKESISICPYYNIKTEYRAFYLNGEIIFIYGKEKPYVIGDGKRNVLELIREIKLPHNKVTKENLSNINMEYVPKNGEKFYVSWKHNLSGGAKVSLLENGKLYHDIENVAKAAGQAINIKFATIDIIQTVEGEIHVMEINSTVGTTIFAQIAPNGYEKAKMIYIKALNQLFDE